MARQNAAPAALYTTRPPTTVSRTWGREGAVQSSTDAQLARNLATRLKRPSGEIPGYDQIVVRVKFTDGVPTGVSYVTAP